MDNISWKLARGLRLRSCTFPTPPPMKHTVGGWESTNWKTALSRPQGIFWTSVGALKCTLNHDGSKKSISVKKTLLVWSTRCIFFLSISLEWSFSRLAQKNVQNSHYFLSLVTHMIPCTKQDTRDFGIKCFWFFSFNPRFFLVCESATVDFLCGMDREHDFTMFLYLDRSLNSK